MVNLPSKDSVTANGVDMVSVRGHEACNSEVTNAAYNGSSQKKQATRDSVDVWKNDAGCDEEDDTVYAVSIEVKLGNQEDETGWKN